ncbi:hypothetical protein HMPREF9141_1594 [Prevotella multiformis DSM 16608]|uniref:Uncharacterized protein n=1 Tax=Prevotella multiformis DSM 16608 TaxID=888743 RepID=F0F7M7_9BACT|nr:hypothetical protein HMPREF9141_1594 [Prevotella multiformis DSM 16608]
MQSSPEKLKCGCAGGMGGERCRRKAKAQGRAASVSSDNVKPL